jgi:hypothetical protein
LRRRTADCDPVCRPGERSAPPEATLVVACERREPEADDEEEHREDERESGGEECDGYRQREQEHAGSEESFGIHTGASPERPINVGDEQPEASQRPGPSYRRGIVAAAATIATAKIVAATTIITAPTTIDAGRPDYPP